MDNLGERLKLLRKHLGLTQLEFARRIGIGEKTLRNYESGKFAPKESVLKTIEQTFSVNPSWLMEGKGEMFKPKGEGKIIATPEFVIKPIPLIAEGEAGLGAFIPNLAEPEKVIWFPVPAKWAGHKLFFVRVVGNSMEPRIFEGDTVLVDKDAPIGKGDLVAALLKDGELVIKRIRRKNGFVFLESINPAYEPIIVKDKDIKDLALVRFIVPKGSLVSYEEERD
jgi:repressor LexA